MRRMTYHAIVIATRNDPDSILLILVEAPKREFINRAVIEGAVVKFPNVDELLTAIRGLNKDASEFNAGVAAAREQTGTTQVAGFLDLNSAQLNKLGFKTMASMAVHTNLINPPQ